MRSQLQLSAVERKRLKCALVASYNVVKAYQKTLSVGSLSDREREWLDVGLRKTLARTYEYKRQLDAVHQPIQRAS
jgi:hypothetical protein